MSSEKVDKHWQKAGLASYSEGAIIATLVHYGVPVDAALVKELAAKRYPLSMAAEWIQSWKGTGQFAPFPLAAADELWRRSRPDTLSPDAVAETLADLVNELGELLGRGKSPALDAAFAKAEGVLPKVPQKDGSNDEDFLDDVFGRMDEALIRAFDEVAEQLAKAGKVSEAERFASVEETLMPPRKGVVRALIQAAKGDQAGAVSALVALGNDGTREGATQLLPIDGLIHLGANEESLKLAKAQLEKAETAKDYHLALELCGRVAHVLEKLDRHEEMEALEVRMEKIASEHDAAHPHHSHEG
ncbi:MAG: hypothetical protein ACT4TC_06340 [Myxococcaceae bacterium]